MTAPRLEIALDKIEHNARTLRKWYAGKGIQLTAVTKGVCGAPQVARALLRSGINSLGDSRLANIRAMRQAGVRAEFMLVRSPMLSQVADAVELADISLNSEIVVLRALSECAAGRGKRHRVILMVELGDLREGVLPQDVDPIVAETVNLPGIDLVGVGTNLACFGGVRPTDDKMQQLSAIAGHIEGTWGCSLQIISGGNSSNYQWTALMPDMGRINHLRIGESILLGCDPLTRQPLPGLYTDAFTLIGEVIELKTKPSRPDGTIAQDAFGHVPHFVDKGNIRRAILALGRQDIDVSTVKPCLQVDILGASSDHLLLDATGVSLEVGDEIRFDLAYGALLRTMTSPYIVKEYQLQSNIHKQYRHHRQRVLESTFRPATARH